MRNARVLASRMRPLQRVDRRRSIGDLDKEWRIQRRMANGGLGFLPGMHHPVRPNRAVRHGTHVQPFGVLRAPAVPVAVSEDVSSSLAARPNWLVSDLTAIQDRLKAILSKWHWRPVVYTAQKGLSTNWHTRSLRAVELIGIPLIVILFLALGSLNLWDSHQPQTGGGSGRSQPSSVSQSKNASVVLPGGSTAGSSNTSSTSSPTPLEVTSNSPVHSSPVGHVQTLTPTPATSPVPATQTITDVIPPTSSESPSPTPSVPGVTTPLPVTIPGVNLTGGDSKPIVSTSPTSVTLN